MERDVKAVDHRDEMANEGIMTKIEDKMPTTVQDKWSDIVVDEDLENSPSSAKFTRLMKFLGKFKDKAEYHISKHEASGLKSKSCVITGTTLMANVVQGSGDTPGKAEAGAKGELEYCLACSKDGNKSEAARHVMGSCKVFKAMPYNEKIKLVKCIKCPFSNKDGHKTSDCKNSRIRCFHCQSNDHVKSFCDKISVSAKSNVASASSLTSRSSSNVLLKSMTVKGSDGENLNVLEDNCSTDNYIAFEATRRLNLKPVCDVILKIEGINCVKKIDSSLFRVPVMKEDGCLEYVECYGLENITEKHTPLDPDMYAAICGELEVSPDEVQRPESIDMLLSARSGHLMSDNVIKESNGLKLFQGPLGKTISGNAKTFSAEHVTSYPSQAIPVIASSCNKSVTERLTDNGILNFSKKESYLLNKEGVKEISAKSDVDEWNNVSSKDNWVADITTRGASPDRPGSDWQSGPKWLVQSRELLPVTDVSLDKSDREVIKSFEQVSFKAKSNVDSLKSIGELHPGPDGEGLGELHGPQQAGELHMGPALEKHVLDDLIDGSESLDKIVNTTDFVPRLAGRAGKKIPESYKKLGLQ